MNSTDKAYRRDQFLLDFLDSGCPAVSTANKSDYDEAISEYQMLLSEAIRRNDTSEIKQLRAEIQRTKAEKRMIENKSEKEFAYT